MFGMYTSLLSVIPRYMQESRSDSVLVIEDNTGCIRYKLLGECPFGDHCHFGHLNKPIAL